MHIDNCEIRETKFIELEDCRWQENIEKLKKKMESPKKIHTNVMLEQGVTENARLSIWNPWMYNPIENGPLKCGVCKSVGNRPQKSGVSKSVEDKAIKIHDCKTRPEMAIKLQGWTVRGENKIKIRGSTIGGTKVLIWKPGK